VQAGVHARVLAVAWEKQSESNAMWALSIPVPFSMPVGAGAGGYFAPHVRSYIRKSGAPENIGAIVAAKDRRNGARNPLAHLKQPDITVESVQASQMLWDPIRFAETCPSSDGACAMVIGNEEAADRVEEGRLELEMAEVDLAALVRRTAERFEPQFDEAGVRLHSLVTGKLMAHADADRLGQVVGNLLGNALRATRERTDGEVLLGIARTTEGGHPVARLTVTDNGVGLAPDELTKIFERFYRAPRARDTEGSGIGLTIARDIVRAHGGELTANSPGPGKGATLTLTLPLA